MARTPYHALATHKGGWFVSAPLPVAAPGHQLVVFPRGGVPYVLPSGSTIRNADFKNAVAIYDVDMGVDQHDVTSTVDSLNDAFSFEVTARIRYRASEPLKLIERQVADTHSDVQKLVLATISVVTRDLDPRQLSEAQRAVRRRVEGEDGTAADKLRASGYTLESIEVTLRRDRRLVESDVRVELAEVAEREREQQRRHTLSAIDFTRVLLASDYATRAAYLIHAPSEDLRRVLDEMTLREQSEQQAVYKILADMAPSLDQGRQELIFKWLQQRTDQHFSQSRTLQDGGSRALLDSVATPPKNPDKKDSPPPSSPSNDDDWDD